MPSDVVERLQAEVADCAPGTCDHCDDIRAVLAENERLRGKIEAALELHLRRDSHGYCVECKNPTHWECDTVKVLLGGNDAEPLYPCEKCGVLRTKAEGGTTFTVCDKCWDEHWGGEE
jgi:hypothetical protein